MSYIDTSMDPALRAKMLSEVKTHLPGFLSAASTERRGPVNAAAELLNLQLVDIRRVLAVHMMLAEPIRDFVSDLPTGIRRPITASTRPRVAGPTVTSGIDWAATVRHRATSGPAGGIWVTRPAQRIFDVPENQALLWVLSTLEERAAVAASPGVAGAPWGQEIKSMGEAACNKRRIVWLEGISTEWPGDGVYERLHADRLGFYRIRLSNAAKYLRRLLIDPPPGDVADAICERFFEPTQDWKLFEIAVLLRIANALKNVGEPLGRSSLLVGGRSSFAQYKLSATKEIRLWYQMWPPESGPSELDDAVSHYQLKSAPTRPDIVVEFLTNGVSDRLIVLELKASTEAGYLTEGLSQLLGYLRDRSRLTSSEAAGWLVAPPSDAYTMRSADGRSLWVVSSDAVADTVKAAVSQYVSAAHAIDRAWPTDRPDIASDLPSAAR